MKLFGIQFGKQKKVATVPVHIDLSGQPYKLQDKMIDARMVHEQTVVADIPKVRVTEEAGKAMLYFCGIDNIKIKKEIGPGDGSRYIPDRVTLDNIQIKKGFKPGYYNLKNVKLHSNGSINVIAMANTEFERV